MKHTLSSDDRDFSMEFEACRIAPELFDHRAHIRLAYIYLAENEDDAALALMRRTPRS